MGRFNYVVVAICSILLFSCHITINTRGNKDNTYRAKSSGMKVTKMMKVPYYNGVDVSAGMDVILTDENKDWISSDNFCARHNKFTCCALAYQNRSIRIECDPFFYNSLNISVDGGVLKLGVKSGVERVYQNNRIKVYVPAAGVSTFAASHGTNIISQVKIAVPKLEVRLVSSSDMISEVECGMIIAVISGTSDLKLQGTTDVFELYASMYADADCNKLIANKVICGVSGSSDVSVYADEEIKIEASGSSSVYYGGDAKIVNINTSNNADVIKRSL